MANQYVHTRARIFLSSGIILAVAIGLSACGEGTKGSSGGGTLTIQTSSPGFDAQNVGLNTPISITVAEALDGTSINGQTVHLMPAPMGDSDHQMSSDNEDSDMMAEIISGSAQLVGTNTIQFTPNTALSPGTRYHFHISGLKLASGKQLRTGTDELEFFFTTAHSHESKRIYYNESGVQICTRETAVQNNERTMRRYTDQDCTEVSRTVRRAVEAGGTLPLTTHYKTATHSPVANGIPVAEYTEDGGGNVLVYEREYNQNGVDYVRFRADSFGSTNFLATDWWSDVEMHGAHMITYSYQAVGAGVANFNPANAKNPSEFVLDDASLMEMNHNLTVPQAGMFPHRHIFYRSLGGDGKIDMDVQGNPTITDDLISAYHTREYDAEGKRVKDWTFKGNSTRQNGQAVPNGNTVTFNPQTDLATRVRVYHFDPATKQRKARFTYEFDAGKSVTEWNTILANLQASPTAVTGGVVLHDYRVYTYDFSGNLTSIDVIHECDTACTPYNDPVYGQLTNMYKEQTRTYTTQPTVAF